MGSRRPDRFSPAVVRQLFILALCRFAEPVALTSVFPYLYYMIKSFGVPQKDISFYAGITGACFSFAQFFTGILWGRASDKYGRKPTILLGLLGTLTCLLLFGFSTSLAMAIFARTLSGLVNGNVGILRTTVAEMVPQKSLQPRAFSVMPLVWSIGSILGPMIGGALADPLTNHPEWFHGRRPALFKKFPFALPNIAASVLFLLGLPIGVLFLEETLATKKGLKDPGLEMGRKLLRKLGIQPSVTDAGSTAPLLRSDEETLPAVKTDEKPPPLRAALTFHSVVNIIVYGLLALHSVTFDQLLPVLMAYPPEDPAVRSAPFKFAGGLGMSSSEVGMYFSVYGIVGMFLQFFIFPPVTNWLGSLRCLRIVAFCYPLVYFALPFLLVLPEHLQRPALFAVMFVKCVSSIFAFPCSTILLTNSSPSLRVLGTLNGIAVAASALGRASGPATFGALFSYGQQIGYVIFPWWILAIVTFFSALPTLILIEGEGFAEDNKVLETDAQEDEDSEEERLLANKNSPENDYGTLSTASDERPRMT